MAAQGGNDSTVWRRQAWRNVIQSLTLLLTMGGLLSLFGWRLWETVGIMNKQLHKNDGVLAFIKAFFNIAAINGL